MPPPAPGITDGVLFADCDPGSQAQILITNSIPTGYTVAIASSYTPTYAGYFSASESRASYNCLFGNSTNIDADLVALGSPYIENNITSDPLLGSADSCDANDYKVSAGSPMLGAGEVGADIGLGRAS